MQPVPQTEEGITELHKDKDIKEEDADEEAFSWADELASQPPEERGRPPKRRGPGRQRKVGKYRSQMGNYSHDMVWVSLMHWEDDVVPGLT